MFRWGRRPDGGRESLEAPARQEKAWRTRAQKLLGLAAALAFFGGGLLLLNTPIGERFLASRIAERTFPNGLNIRIGGSMAISTAPPYSTMRNHRPRVFSPSPAPRWTGTRVAAVEQAEIDSFAAPRDVGALAGLFSEEEGLILASISISKNWRSRTSLWLPELPATGRSVWM